MRLDDQRRSENIDDRRGQRGRGGGMGPGARLGAGGFGIGGIILVGLLLLFFPQAAPFVTSILGLGGPSQVAPTPGEIGKPDDRTGDIIAAQLGSMEDVWTKLYADGRMSHYGAPAGSCCSRARSPPPAARPPPPRGRSTARATTRCIWTRASSRT
jgi:hypothetical protein